MTIKTNYPRNFDKAENELFSWNESFPGELLHKPSNMVIYQMRWTKTGKMVDEETREAVKNFWEELEVIQDAAKKAQADEAECYIEEYGFGWCEKCESYCYGDCAAN